MVKKIRRPQNDQELIKNLLLQRAAEQATSRRWNLYSLLFIWAVLILVIVLRLEEVNLYIIGGAAFLGLTGLWFFTFRHGKKLEIQIYQQTSEYYQNLSPSDILKNQAGNQEESGTSVLSQRELEVLCCIVQGNANKEIARNMFISEQTAKNHITHILKKMNVTDRTSAAVMALRLGWIRSVPGGQFEITLKKDE